MIALMVLYLAGNLWRVTARVHLLMRLCSEAHTAVFSMSLSIILTSSLKFRKAVSMRLLISAKYLVMLWLGCFLMVNSWLVALRNCAVPPG
jgi:hypothetical protein